ncbi:Universal stress protein UspA or related nucleotide-binding protein [Dehalogenimonas alkenigignens]|uniref:Universal stress protein UspA or related nucleotide-binding protein n=1 Tax=Dehalogenimonas alkenigignens TaxID=1217799 RepID=A0A0W0GGZ6_9CHLR|nr:universal stress protein [Dehalogenimonas alkenigignens]KTB47819.1 Universal stress protein UspA or related nucleotide-binding protein [Dehalogenimonas alkenigignens]
MFKTVIVPLDGSPVSEQVLPKVVELAKCFSDAKFILLQVIQPLSSSVTGTLALSTVGEIMTLTHGEASDYLRDIAARILPDKNVRTIVEEGEPAVMILQTAREMKADLIAMASHGRSGIARLALGSVTDRVISHAEIPVLVIKAV